MSGRNVAACPAAHSMCHFERQDKPSLTQDIDCHDGFIMETSSVVDQALTTSRLTSIVVSVEAVIQTGCLVKQGSLQSTSASGRLFSFVYSCRCSTHMTTRACDLQGGPLLRDGPPLFGEWEGERRSAVAYPPVTMYTPRYQISTPRTCVPFCFF